MFDWDEIACQRGCTEHFVRDVDVFIGGPTLYHDLTEIPPRFAGNLRLKVWDTDLQPADGGPYCPARDVVSETILALGVWEPPETATLLLCWEMLHDDCLFVDIGAQIGWFSAIAAARNIRVLAVEADPEVVKLTQLNIDAQHGEAASLVVNERVGPDTELPLGGGWSELPIVAKIDIEGAEEHAIDALQVEIDRGRVPFLLVEMSPTFNDSYPHLASRLLDDGYRMYAMPPKQRPPWEINNLEALLPFEVTGNRETVMAEVASWHQRDVLFAHGGIG